MTYAGFAILLTIAFSGNACAQTNGSPASVRRDPDALALDRVVTSLSSNRQPATGSVRVKETARTHEFKHGEEDTVAVQPFGSNYLSQRRL